jgi:probable aminopeptidase NPEPL1
MKNSVKDRSNAPSSGAGHFIEDHISPEAKGTVKWAHVDLAAPTTFPNGRGTGFGSSLLIQFAKDFDELIK